MRWLTAPDGSHDRPNSGGQATTLAEEFQSFMSMDIYIYIYT